MPPKKAVRRRERRRMSRADAQLGMRVEAGSADGGLIPIVTESRNISGSGVYCLSPHYLAPLSKVALTIVLPEVPGRAPGQRLLKCEGIVVRCQGSAGARRDREYELACSFLGLDAAARELLDEYVVWRNLQALRTGPRPVRTRPGATARATAARKPRAAAAARGAATRGAATAAARSVRRTVTRKRGTVH
ncbi:MAG: PilZ domain-containing protein [Candidatus Eisenbacteria bacterium]|uniref:PilZ domain-containing protein n=1 Tax=Eiseniibacteriota bacterium TaxID=2212470 RepID=A0A538U9N8_UNCEI|nr:MAG: PilZ domain-containing protein [Candidatus Eisenbacteria bacterium]